MIISILRFSINNRFQEHLINYNEPHDYAMLTTQGIAAINKNGLRTFAMSSVLLLYGDDKHELFTAIPALRL